MTVDMTNSRLRFVKALKAAGLYDRAVLTKAELEKVAAGAGLGYPYWMTRLKAGRGAYTNPLILPEVVDVSPKGASSTSVRTAAVKPTKGVARRPRNLKVFRPEPVVEPTTTTIPLEGEPIAPAAAVSEAPEGAAALSVTTNVQIGVPPVNPLYVPWGNHADVRQVIASGLFYPMFITGLSGNGKTLMIQQACAELGRELIRINITEETDEDDLIGGFRLENGHTVWHNGPVVEAMLRGAICLLDEVDFGSNKILCLQPVLEGNGIYIKKINRHIRPTKGFNLFAAANTKGKGSEDGTFIGTNVMNEAFLERFAVTMEQEYPAEQVETDIVLKAMESVEAVDADFATNLVRWASLVRKTYADGGVTDVISTRRLVHIVGAFGIWRNKTKAITLCLNRFDAETKQSFITFYQMIDKQAAEEAAAKAAGNAAPTAEATTAAGDEDCPF